MLRLSTAPRWNIVMRVLRRPEGATDSPCASAVRFRNEGALPTSPTLASATLLCFRNNLRFITSSPSTSIQRRRQRNNPGERGGGASGAGRFQFRDFKFQISKLRFEILRHLNAPHAPAAVTQPTQQSTHASHLKPARPTAGTSADYCR